jgi:hypothetical protein
MGGFSRTSIKVCGLYTEYPCSHRLSRRERLFNDHVCESFWCCYLGFCLLCLCRQNSAKFRPGISRITMFLFHKLSHFLLSFLRIYRFLFFQGFYFPIDFLLMIIFFSFTIFKLSSYVDFEEIFVTVACTYVQFFGATY